MVDMMPDDLIKMAESNEPSKRGVIGSVASYLFYVNLYFLFCVIVTFLCVWLLRELILHVLGVDAAVYVSGTFRSLLYLAMVLAAGGIAHLSAIRKSIYRESFFKGLLSAWEEIVLQAKLCVGLSIPGSPGEVCDSPAVHEQRDQ